MRDIHKKEFDTATKIKLHILREYIKEWLPVFIQKREEFWKNITIYDFFAGEGKDLEGNQGSPMIIIDELESHHTMITSKGLNIELVLNDNNRKKIQKLKECVGNKNKPYKIIYKEEDFTELFNELYSDMIKTTRQPKFMFLDQYGIKFITPYIFKKITSLKRTDFLFFISSSFLQRFSEQKEFQNYLKISKEEFDKSKPYHCHRVIFNYFKSQIPTDKEYYLAPFSLRKEKGNVYGLIFGTNHLLGIEKFMKVAWSIDSNTGEANFNIDKDYIQTEQTSLLGGFGFDTRPNKIQLFEKDLKKLVTNKKITTLLDIYKFTYEYGCLPIHANKVIRELKKIKIINDKIKTVNSRIHKINNINLFQ